MGPRWHHVGTISGHFGPLGRLQGRFRFFFCCAPGRALTSLGQFWDHFETILGPIWYQNGTILGPFWDQPLNQPSLQPTKLPSLTASPPPSLTALQPPSLTAFQLHSDLTDPSIHRSIGRSTRQLIDPPALKHGGGEAVGTWIYFA